MRSIRCPSCNRVFLREELASGQCPACAGTLGLDPLPSAAPPTVAESRAPQKDGLAFWKVAVAAGVLAVAGLAVFLAVRSGRTTSAAPANPQASAAVATVPPRQATPLAQAQMQVKTAAQRATPVPLEGSGATAATQPTGSSPVGADLVPADKLAQAKPEPLPPAAETKPDPVAAVAVANPPSNGLLPSRSVVAQQGVPPELATPVPQPKQAQAVAERTPLDNPADVEPEGELVMHLVNDHIHVVATDKNKVEVVPLGEDEGRPAANIHLSQQGRRVFANADPPGGGGVQTYAKNQELTRRAYFLSKARTSLRWPWLLTEFPCGWMRSSLISRAANLCV
jgi:hypothetical protein